MNKAEYKKLVLAFQKEWEKKLRTYNAYQLARQIREYQTVSSIFTRLIEALIAKGTGLTPDQIFRLAEYKTFVEEANKQMQRYATFNANLTVVAQRDMVTLGLQNSQELLSLINVNFNRLPVEAIDKWIGVSADGSPLYDIFLKRFNDNTQQALDIMTEGIARGLNPVDTARLMTKQLEVSRYDATRITRTETINIYNQTNYDQMKTSGIVEEYLWLAEDSACSECLEAEANAPYRFDDSSAPVPTLHPHCLCAIAPNIG